MTYTEKDILSKRIDKALIELDYQYEKARAQAEEFYASYEHEHENAKNFHEQRFLLLEAKAQLWRGDMEEF